MLIYKHSLKAIGQNPDQAKIWFANGNDGCKTVRYIDKGQ